MENSILTYDDLKKIHVEASTKEIPKYIFRTGPMSKENLPSVMVDLYNETITSNPGYSFFYFSDADCYNFISQEWGEEYVKCYLKILPSAYRADLFRYLLLYNYGGCYGDFSQKMHITYDELCNGFEQVFCKDTGSNHVALYNALMCSYSKNPTIKRAIDISIDNIKNNVYGISSLDITGPIVLGKAYRENRVDGKLKKDAIELGIFDKTKIIMNPGFQNFIVDTVSSKIVCDKKIPEHTSVIYQNGEYYDASWNKRHVYGEYEETTFINDLLTHYGSNRITNHYDSIYHSLFGNTVETINDVLEIGFTSANSLKVWKNYFPNANIYGINSNVDIKINTTRIKTYHSGISNAFDNIGVDLDVIIINRLDTLENNVQMLEAVLPFLKKGGICIVEGINKMLPFYNDSRFLKLIEGRTFKSYSAKDNIKVITIRN